MQAQKKRMQKGHSLFYNHAQQPPDVVACSAQYRVQTVTERCLEVAAVHAVIGFEVADDGLDGLSAFEVFLLLLRQALVFSYIYSDNQIPRESRQTLGLPLFEHRKKNRLWITFWRIFSSMKSTLNHQNHGKALFS